MTRTWYAGIPVFLAAIAVATAASAEPLRVAKIGESMGALVAGLNQVEGTALGSCSTGSPIISYVNYIVPGRPEDDDNASFQALTAGDRIVAMVAYDEQDLNTPVAVYADMDGNGLITNVWPIQNAPAPCAIMETLRYHP